MSSESRPNGACQRPKHRLKQWFVNKIKETAHTHETPRNQNEIQNISGTTQQHKHTKKDFNSLHFIKFYILQYLWNFQEKEELLPPCHNPL